MRKSLVSALYPPEPAEAGLSASVIDDPAALVALEAEWRDLWRRTLSATPFQSPAWLIPWYAEFAPGPLFVGAVRNDGRLVALLPSYREQSAAGTRLMPLGVSLSDYLDVLIDPACPEAARALTRLVGGARWDRCCFEELPPGALAAAMPAPEDSSDAVEVQSACPVLALRGGRNLEGCVPARRRRQLRRAWAAASRLGEVRVERAERDSARFLKALFALHAARWRDRDQSRGVLADERVRRFHRAALPRLAAASLARCALLTIAGKTVAAYYGFLARGRAYAYLGGFDPAFEEASPGSILIGHSIAEAIEEGADEFHFLRGREAYKYSWGAADRWNRRRVWARRPHAL